MKTVVVAALALLAGLFLGGLGPRAELRDVRRELAEAKQAAERARSSSALPFALGMGGLAAARERADEQAANRLPRFVIPDAGPAVAERTRPDGGRRGFRFDEQSFAAAKAAGDLRAAQFRDAFVAEARLSPEAQTALDKTVDDMNAEFGKAAGEVAEALRKKGQKVGARDMADIGVRLLQIYQHADDAFKAGLDDTGRAAAERTRFDVLTQVDVGAFRALADTMGQLGVNTPGRQP
jgi:hypothetical protein